MLLPVLLLLLLLGVPFAIAMSRAKRQKSDSGIVGYDDRGQPIYRVVGYSADGRPITANHATGVAAYSGKTNSLAVVALVLGVVVGPLGIPIGHISRAQIKATGEQGAGMALAGLVLGYLSLVWIAVLIAVVALN